MCSKKFYCDWNQIHFEVKMTRYIRELLSLFFFCVCISAVNDNSLLLGTRYLVYTACAGASDFGNSFIVNFASVPQGVYYIPSMSGDGTVIVRDHATHGGYSPQY